MKETNNTRMRNTKKKDSAQVEDWARRFEGAWKDSKPPEQIIESIRNDRTPNRENKQ